MENLYEKVAYLNGLIDGMEFDKTSKEGKALSVIAEILEEMVDLIGDIDDEQAEMEEYLDLMDEDLSNVEEELFGEFDIDELDDDDDDLEEVDFDEE